MRSALKLLRGKQGYTLIELAISITIIGLIMAPAAYLYSIYQQKQDIEQTDKAHLVAIHALEGFRSIYGRYPCPAPMDAVRGDSDYGYELIDGGGQCQEQVDAVELATSARAILDDAGDPTCAENPDIYIGALPFRQMNLPEEMIVDGYNNRLLYAITDVLTDSTTFNPLCGGISVVDLNDDSLLTAPGDSAHFVVVSAGRQNGGATSALSGVQVSSCPSSTLEEENCDDDNVFRTGLRQPDFDDLVSYQDSDTEEQWQISTQSPIDIHLRRANSVVLGVDDPNNSPGANQTLVVRQVGGVDGKIRADNAFQLEQICGNTGDPLNCFEPSLIGGAGLQCPGDDLDGTGQFLVGIEGKSAICEDEIWFRCPAGEFVTGVDGSGHIVCGAEPPAMCQDEVLATTCGPTRTITTNSNYFYNGSYYGYGYSGTCYKIATIDLNHVSSLGSIQDVQNYIDSLNAAQRTAEECGSSPSGNNRGLVRDGFKCVGGQWDTEPGNIIKMELGNQANWSDPPSSPTAGDTADLGGASYNPVLPMSVDQAQNQDNHECWCREDYKLVPSSCPGSSSGQQFLIQHHRCPQTYHDWTNVGGWNTQFCQCVETVVDQYPNCNDYYTLPSGHQLVGTVHLQVPYTCPSGPNGPPVEGEPVFISESCQCPNYSTLYTPHLCPSGYSNDWEYPSGVSRDGVAYLDVQEWECPGGNTPNNAGYWENPTIVNGPACVCDNNVAPLLSSQVQTCSDRYGPGFEGTVYHRKEWTCPNGYGDWMYDYDTCNRCKWHAGAPNGGLVGTYSGPPVESACNSCSNSGPCHQFMGSGQYQNYSSCYCAPQGGP